MIGQQRDIQNSMKNQDYDLVAEETQRVIQHQGIKVVPGSIDVKLVQRSVLEVLGDVVEIYLSRANQNFATEDTIFKKYEDMKYAGMTGAGSQGAPIIEEKRLSEAIENKISEGMDNKNSLDTLVAKVKWLPFIIGDVYLTDITFQLMNDFREKLWKMPNRLNRKEYQGKTAEELLT